MIAAVSLAIAIRSSTVTVARPVRSAIIAWAAAAPMAPASWRSTRPITSGVGSGKKPSRPCPCASASNSASASSSPRIRCVRISRPSASAWPRTHGRGPIAASSKMFTKIAPCIRSTGPGKVRIDTRQKPSAFNASDQNMACIKGSSPVIPNRACGRSQPSPNGPCAITPAGMNVPAPNDGRNKAHSQTADPSISPMAAPLRVAPRQKMPPSKAGMNCATPTKAIRPMVASDDPPPDKR